MDLISFFDTETLIWMGILFCISQSAMFSGLNLAFFSMSMLFLEVESSHGNKQAQKILVLRKDSNFLLTTILWGNVGINVLLTLLSDSILAGVSAFAFSTVFITLFGEIFPQAYFSRNALKMASTLYPVLRFYQYLLFIVAKPSALFLDVWLGREGIDYLREQELKNVITKHVEADEADVDHVEGIGALNFLAIDDIKVSHEGEIISPESIIYLPTTIDLPSIPKVTRNPDDPFLQQLHRSGHNWVVLCDEEGEPHLIMDADGALRSAVFDTNLEFEPYKFCHRPMIIKDENLTLDEVILHFKSTVLADKHHDEAIEFDVVLVWGEEKRIITGADLFGRLLKGIVSH